jgi:ankyrin repeat protein
VKQRIIYYVDRGDLTGLIAALQSGEGSINFADVDGRSLLHAATGKNVSVEIAAELIRQGIDVDHCDDEGRTALSYAAKLKRIDVAEVILNAGGRLDISDRYGNQPLWYAVHSQYQNHDMIRLFVQHGADPRHRNFHGKSPTDLATTIGIADILTILGGATDR